MVRRATQVSLGNKTTRFAVTIEDDETMLDSPEAAQRQIPFLKEVLACPDILLCGFNPFQKMVVTHTGTRWTIQTEALVYDAEDDKLNRGC
jgi:hypothetical protein